MSMSVGEAFHYLRELDEIFFKLHFQKMELLGELQCGVPGYPRFNSVSEIARRMETRKAQIAELRLEIAELQNSQSVDEPMVRQIAREFDLPPFKE